MIGIGFKDNEKVIDVEIRPSRMKMVEEVCGVYSERCSRYLLAREFLQWVNLYC